MILNALDVFHDTRNRGSESLSGDLENLGWQCAELDLREFFGKPDRLALALAESSLVWAVGGNAFVLARAMSAAGLRTVVESRRKDPDFAYGGFSAGACVAGPDLAGLHVMDDPAVLPDGYTDSMPAAALRLIDDRIVPHWRSAHPEANRAEEARRWMEEHQLAHRCLKDGEALVAEL